MPGKVQIQRWHSSNVCMNLTVPLPHVGLHRYTQAWLGSSPEPIIPTRLSLDAMHQNIRQVQIIDLRLQPLGCLLFNYYRTKNYFYLVSERA